MVPTEFTQEDNVKCASNRVMIVTEWQELYKREKKPTSNCSKEWCCIKDSFYWVAVTWLEYCRYGVKYNSIILLQSMDLNYNDTYFDWRLVPLLVFEGIRVCHVHCILWFIRSQTPFFYRLIRRHYMAEILMIGLKTPNN